MSAEKIDEIVASAVGRKFDEWASLHPSLAAVIDRVRLTDRTVELLRDSDAYRRAVEAYHRDRNEMNLLTRLAELAGPVVATLLGL